MKIDDIGLKTTYDMIWQLDNQLYAMKVLKKLQVLEHGELKRTRTEKRVLSKAQSAFLVNLRYSFQTKTEIYLVMDYVCGGEVFGHLQEVRRFSEKRAKFYACQGTRQSRRVETRQSRRKELDVNIHFFGRCIHVPIYCFLICFSYYFCHFRLLTYHIISYHIHSYSSTGGPP